MQLTEINISLNTPEGPLFTKGRGYHDFPFTVHRKLSKRTGDIVKTGSYWVITHTASGRSAFEAKTLKDAEGVIRVLKGFSLFYMPMCQSFIDMCKSNGAAIFDALEDAGFNKDTMRFE